MKGNVVIRKARDLDAIVIAKILRLTRVHDLPFLPVLHTPEEDLVYIRNIILVEDSVFLAENDGVIVGFCAYKDGLVDHLYVLPEYQRRGIGRGLLDEMKRNNAELRLWVFQRNERARKFYERNGFDLIEETDGAGNEEREPDALYVWKK